MRTALRTRGPGARLGQQAPGQPHGQQADGRQQPEYGAPAHGGGDGAAHDRRQAGPHHHHEIHQRQLTHGRVGLGGVAHDGPPQGEARAPAQALEQARAQQQVQIRCQRRRKPRHGIQDQPGDEHGPPPHGIGQGPVQQLARSQAEDVQADRHLHFAHACGQAACRERQGRDEHVHGHGTVDGDHDQQPDRRPGTQRRRAQGWQMPGAGPHSQSARRWITDFNGPLNEAFQYCGRSSRRPRP